MPIWTPTIFDDKMNVFTQVLGIPTSAGDPAFDSELKLTHSGSHNHVLDLKLRIFLDKFMPPLHLKTWIYQDFDRNFFVIGPWSHGEWQRFVHGFKQQCAMWNDKFWLIPPAGFSQLDVNIAGKPVRPNIYCHLTVEITPSADHAHRVIKVVNLDAKSAARAAGKRESDVTSGDFRSDSGTYDTFDVRPRWHSYTDNSGNARRVRHYTIAHEIGHALGEDHIGVIRHDPMCDMAVVVDRSFKGVLATAVPAIMAGGSNSKVCYGDFAAASVGANVMGGGGKFEPVNAQPWIDQMARHTRTATPWTVSMAHIAPKRVA